MEQKLRKMRTLAVPRRNKNRKPVSTLACCSNSRAGGSHLPMRCVEGGDGDPKGGIPLREIIRRAAPTGNAGFVEFATLDDPWQIPGQRPRALEWLYVEGRRMDEAKHPLTLVAKAPLVKRCPARTVRRSGG
jgi:DMSO/TMAO reductase YedYZ molybdopterin-dependent catalytic subunit